MVDMPIGDQPSQSGQRELTTARSLKWAQRLLLAVLLVWGSWAAISELAAEDRCETRLGKLSVRLKLDSYYSGCRCMKHSLDFSDPCNSGYIPMLR